MEVPQFDLTSQEFKRDPLPTYARMRELGPVFRMKLDFVGEAWVATTHEAVIKVLRGKEDWATNPKTAGRKNMVGFGWWMPDIIRVLTENMLQKDDPDHRRLRSLVESAFLKQSIEQLRPRLEVLVDEQLDELERHIDQEGSVEFVEHFARALPLRVIMELMGLPEEDRPRFEKLGSRMTNTSGSVAITIAGMVPTLWKLNRYFKKQFKLLRKNPRPGMLSALVAAEQEGEQLNERELRASAFLLLFAGHETTVHLMTLSLITLQQHPEQKSKLMADWSLAPSAVEELLRYISSIQTTKPRYARHDMEFFGQQIKQGEVMMPWLGAANSDPNVFQNPDELDLTRSFNPHVAFGSGMHLCLGQKLVWAEMEIALQKLFTRFPHLDLTTPPEQLEWSKRIGSRMVQRLPLTLNGDVSSEAEREQEATRISH